MIIGKYFSVLEGESFLEYPLGVLNVMLVVLSVIIYPGEYVWGILGIYNLGEVVFFT